MAGGYQYETAPHSRQVDSLSPATSFLAHVIFTFFILYYIISMSPFVDLSTSDSVDPAMEKSNFLNQITFVLLTSLIWIYKSIVRTRVAAADIIAIISVITIWFAVSSLGSDEPIQSLKHLALASLTCMNAAVILLLPDTERQFARMLLACCFVALLLSYFGVAFLPHLAIHQESEIREPMNAGLWRGHFPHKNAASANMVIVLFVCLYAYELGKRWSSVAIGSLAMVFLLFSGGKAAMAALPGILFLAFVFERVSVLRPIIVVAGIIVCNVVTIGSSTSGEFRQAVGALGIDPTFTNRIDIWRIGVDAFLSRPFLGHGFEGFWQNKLIVFKAGTEEDWAYAAFNGHNAYLDTALTTGIPGLTLTFLWLIVLPLFDFRRAQESSNSTAQLRLFTRIWMYGIFVGCVESIFYSSGNFLWIATVMSVCGIHYRTKTSLFQRLQGHRIPIG